MRTDLPTVRAATVDRMRAELGRARRRFKSQPPPVRWSLGLAALAALAALAYAATGTPTPAGGYVRSGERFAADDLIAVRRALDARRVRYKVDDRKRVEVAADQIETANEAVAKLPIGPRSFSEIDDVMNASSPWDAIADKQRKRDRAIEAKLEEMIRPLDGVVSAHVLVNRPRPRGGFRPATAATAFVQLETEGDRELSSATVETIQGLVAGVVPDVKRDAVSVFDRKGRPYHDALNPAAGAEVMNRRRRDEMKEEILDSLKWITGVVVSVRLDAAPAIPMPGVLPPLPPDSPVPDPPAATATAAPAEDVGLPPLSMRVNEPIELTPEPADPPPPADLAPAPAPVASAPAAAPAFDPTPSPRAKVWVKVPRSYYLKAMPDRVPSLDDLQPLVERTRGLIETAVRHVVPAGQLDQPVVVSTIPDELPAQGPPPAPPASTGSRRVLSWWLPAGVAVAAAAGAISVAFLLAARRPALRPAARARGDHGRYKIDEPSDPGPGPSERVRDLIRHNPEAAASVLHRWTGQGGTLG